MLTPSEQLVVKKVNERLASKGVAKWSFSGAIHIVAVELGLDDERVRTIWRSAQRPQRVQGEEVK